MKRLLCTLGASVVLAVSLVGSAFADAGPPGSTFPEQPGSHTAGGCAAVTSNPGTGVGGTAGQHYSPQAMAITTGLLADACFMGRRRRRRD
jgi:hypothetical protein